MLAMWKKFGLPASILPRQMYNPKKSLSWAKKSKQQSLALHHHLTALALLHRKRGFAMKISKKLKDYLVKEFKYAAKNMQGAQTPTQKLFYFSATFGAAQRVFNIEYDADLAALHFVLTQTHRHFMDRITQIEKAKEDVVPMFEEQFVKLAEVAKELADNIAGGESMDPQLKKLCLLAYSTTGNGYYLLEKGMLKL